MELTKRSLTALAEAVLREDAALCRLLGGADAKELRARGAVTVLTGDATASLRDGPDCRVLFTARGEILCCDILCSHALWRLGGCAQRPQEIAVRLEETVPAVSGLRFAGGRTLELGEQVGGYTALFAPAGQAVPTAGYRALCEMTFARVFDDPELSRLLCGDVRPAQELCDEGYIRLSARLEITDGQPYILLGVRHLDRPVLTMDIIGPAQERIRLRRIADIAARRIRTRTGGKLLCRRREDTLGRNVRGYLLAAGF